MRFLVSCLSLFMLAVALTISISPNQAEAAAAVTTLNSERNWQSIVKRQSQRRPVLVVFRADWCGYCRRLEPALQRIVRAQNGQVGLVRVDIDKFSELSGKNGVSGIPDVQGWINGQRVGGFVGVQSDAALEALMTQMIRQYKAQTGKDPQRW